MPNEAEKRPEQNFENVKAEVGDTLRQGKESATAALHDARDEIKRKAGEYASDAKEALSRNAGEMQGDIGDRLMAFGGALRAASEHLANSDQRTVSKFVLDAAGGLERLSGSLKNKSFEEVVDEVRSFGRENSTALMAGSVVAGLALGRLFKSADPSHEDEPDEAATPPSAVETGDDQGLGFDATSDGVSSPAEELRS